MDYKGFLDRLATNEALLFSINRYNSYRFPILLDSKLAVTVYHQVVSSTTFFPLRTAFISVSTHSVRFAPTRLQLESHN